jgi:thioredoxin-related protein
MKIVIIAFLSFFCKPLLDWHHNLEEAKQAARLEHKYILLNFSGSDWCAPCIRLRKEIFENENFQQFADTSLILLNADFPRLKKNLPAPDQQKTNDAMAEQYNSKGIFPLTILLNESGKIIKEWEGYPNVKTESFIAEIQFCTSHDK